MTITAVGVAIPVLGQARKVTLTPGRDRPELQRDYFSIDPTMLRTAQPDRIRVDWDHTSAILGDVISLQLRGGQLWAAAELDGQPPTPDAPPVYWSVKSSTRRDGSDVVIDRIAVTDLPAMVCTRSLTFLPGEITSRYDRSKWVLPALERAIVEHAATDAIHRREHGGPIIVTSTERDQPHYERGLTRSRRGPVWRHGGGTVLRVH